MIREKVVVLDDDPTGTQTVYGVPVLTTWGVEALEQELLDDLPCFYILTNTRAHPLERAKAINTEIGSNLEKAARLSKRAFTTVSRGDSTLRGHFPGEVEALAKALGDDFDAWLLIPFFEEGGRVTLDDVHYVRTGEKLIPAGDTEFARDHSFGFRASNLRDWVEEKTSGRTKASEVRSISLEAIRTGNALAQLLAWPKGSIGIVNLETNHDLETFVQDLTDAEACGKRYLYRTAASFVAAKAGITPKPLLTQGDLRLTAGQGGLTLVGSYVRKTSEQLAQLLRVPGVKSLELRVAALLDHRQEREFARVALQLDNFLQDGADVVVYTSRALVKGTKAVSSLSIGHQVSESLVRLVQTLRTRPRYLIAKGGITSSNVATRGLGVKRAMVEGQLLPGVPVWRLGFESRFPELCYVVFPGNVGDAGSLARVVQALRTA